MIFRYGAWDMMMRSMGYGDAEHGIFIIYFSRMFDTYRIGMILATSRGFLILHTTGIGATVILAVSASREGGCDLSDSCVDIGSLK